MDKRCIKCDAILTTDDIGMHKKVINRGAEEFMCLDCLAEYLGVEKSALVEKMEYFKRIGCTVFM